MATQDDGERGARSHALSSVDLWDKAEFKASSSAFIEIPQDEWFLFDPKQDANDEDHFSLCLG